MMNAANSTLSGTGAGPAWAGKAALVAACVAAVVVVWQSWKVVRAWLLPSPTAFVQADANNAERVAAREEALTLAVKQLDGRSLFYLPSRPGEAGTAPVVIEEEAEEEASPTRYEGPAITAIVLDEVWFDDGKKIAAGQGEVDGIEVVRTDAPWGATVKWRGTEFDVKFYERDRVIFKDARRQ